MRRKRRAEKAQKGKAKARNNKRWVGIAGAIVIFAVLLSALVYHFLPHKWDAKSRLVVAMPQENRDVVVSVFDPDTRSIVYFTFPASTQVNASRNLGTWKLGSIWELGKSEKVGGSLLAESIMKTFGIPVDAWMDDGMQILQGHLPRSSETNLSLIERLQLMAFSLSVNKGDKYEIDLTTSGYLRKTKLVSGDAGYVSAPELPLSILSYLADTEVSKLRIGIIDESTSATTAGDLSRVINVLGGKVLNIKDQSANEQRNCEIRAQNIASGKRLSRLFSCSLKEIASSSFDLEIVIGGAFSKRF